MLRPGNPDWQGCRTKERRSTPFEAPPLRAAVQASRHTGKGSRFPSASDPALGPLMLEKQMPLPTCPMPKVLARARLPRGSARARRYGLESCLGLPGPPMNAYPLSLPDPGRIRAQRARRIFVHPPGKRPPYHAVKLGGASNRAHDGRWNTPGPYAPVVRSKHCHKRGSGGGGSEWYDSSYRSHPSILTRRGKRDESARSDEDSRSIDRRPRLRLQASGSEGGDDSLPPVFPP